jgi:magnesium transporter
MDDMETQAALEPDEAAQAAALVILLANERAADIAETLNEESPAVAAAVLMDLPKDHAIEILDQPILDSGSEIVSLMPRETAAALLHGVSADRVADLCRKLEEPHRTELLDRLDPDTRVMIQRLLSYPSHSAGSIMTTEFASVPSNVTVQQTLDYLRKVERTRETVYAIYVLDPVTKNLVQAITLRRLITGDPGAPVLSVARPGRLITVSPIMDREDVARLISKYDLLAVPVVDHGRVIGIVTVDDIMDAIVQETTEDLQKLGGMEALNEPYMEIGF